MTLGEARYNGDTILLINGFHELTDDKRHTLYTFDFFLRSHQLPLETP